MDSTNLSDSIKNLKIKEDKPKATYDKAALKERWKILGNDAEQSKFLKKKKKRRETSAYTIITDIVSMIRKACMNTFARNDFMKTLQTIKASFVQRDYEGIFTESSNLEVYAAAYVPGRALCYYEIFSSRPSLLKLLMKRSQLYCIGSGSGSELVAIAAAMTRVPAERQKIKLVMQDIGEYESVLTSFEETIRERWSVTEDQLSCVYEKGDILDPDNTLIKERMSQADLITFMFVMNELFVKKAAALNLIQTLVKSMKRGAHLLVSERI